MIESEIRDIFDQFQHQSSFLSFKELVSGHINDSFLIKTKTKPYFVLQRINHEVFPNVPKLINNKVSVSNHLLKNSNKNHQNELVFVKNKSENYYHKTESGNYWNLSFYIDDSQTFEKVPNENIAYEGGKTTGLFLKNTEDLQAENFYEVIPNFHSMSFRFHQFDESLKKASEKKIQQSRVLIDKAYHLKKEMLLLEGLKNAGKIKTRLTHNDTKISNILFDSNQKGICMIDTDTVMPGIIHYDFGDAIRTICNTANEDETDLSLVHFDAGFYTAYKVGFLENQQQSLSKLDIEYLPLAAKTMIFIIGLRFLSDFLNNDVYYKTKYEFHNLNRAKNQFQLLDSLVAQESILN